MAKRLQRLCRTPPKRLAAMRAFARRYEENVRFQRRVAGKVLRSSRPPQDRTCEFPRIRLKHLPACRVSREPSTSFATWGNSGITPYEGARNQLSGNALRPTSCGLATMESYDGALCRTGRIVEADIDLCGEPGRISRARRRSRFRA